MNKINVEQWVELFREIGLTDDDMTKWHRLFESRHPEGHQSFLVWLGLDPEHIEQVRNA
ncbi:MAG: hypothetical protein R6W75_10985 [Smithellaceae bacterium]